MRRIENRPLWLGHDRDVRELHPLLDLGVSAVVDVCDTEPIPWLPHEIIRCRFPLAESSRNPSWLVEMTCETVASLIRAGVPTMVVCTRSYSRSACVAAAALALAEDRPILEMLSKIIGSEPITYSRELLVQFRNGLRSSLSKVS